MIFISYDISFSEKALWSRCLCAHTFVYLSSSGGFNLEITEVKFTKPGGYNHNRTIWLRSVAYSMTIHRLRNEITRLEGYLNEYVERDDVDI